MDISKRITLESEENWRKVSQDMPYISFPSGWKVKIIPPFGGAIARMWILLPDGREKSIYADFYDALGYYGSPYWEVYPVSDDVGRCAIENVEKLLSLIAGE